MTRYEEREEQAYRRACDYWRRTLGSAEVALHYWRLHAERAASEGSSLTGHKFRFAATFARESKNLDAGLEILDVTPQGDKQDARRLLSSEVQTSAAQAFTNARKR